MRTVSLTSQAARTTSGHLTELSRGHGAKEGLAKTPQPRRGPHARTHTRCSRKTPSGKVHQETVREEKPGRWGSTPRHEVGAPLGRAPPLGRVLVITQSSRALIHQSGGWALNPPRRALTPLGRALHPSAELRHPSAESCTPRQRSAPLGRDLIHQSPKESLQSLPTDINHLNPPDNCNCNSTLSTQSVSQHLKKPHFIPPLLGSSNRCCCFLKAPPSRSGPARHRHPFHSFEVRARAIPLRYLGGPRHPFR